MIVDGYFHRWMDRHIEVAQVFACETDVGLDPLVALLRDGLGGSTGSGSITSDILKINRCCDDFDITERELRALRQKLPIDDDEGRPVVVQPVTITSLLVRIEVDTSTLCE